MRRSLSLGLLVAMIPLAANSQKKPDSTWRMEFNVAKSELSSTGRNPYFILEPGYQLVLEGGPVRLTITVLDRTRSVDGVETRVVEERETRNGQPVEISRNYFAIGRRTNDIYYFGEEVDIYKDGKIANHEGTWLAGVNGATFGLAMPGHITPGARYYQEIAPKVAMDRAEHVSVDVTVKVPAGEFKKCLKVAETTPLEPGTREYKFYAPGIGLIQDGELKLVKYGRVGRPNQ